MTRKVAKELARRTRKRRFSWCRRSRPSWPNSKQGELFFIHWDHNYRYNGALADCQICLFIFKIVSTIGRKKNFQNLVDTTSSFRLIDNLHNAGFFVESSERSANQFSKDGLPEGDKRTYFSIGLKVKSLPSLFSQRINSLRSCIYSCRIKLGD